MSRKVTNEEYVKRVKDINPNIIVLEPYSFAHIKIKHLCKICGYIWLVVPDAILRKQGCPKCGMKRAGDKKRKSHEIYVNEVKNINSNIEVLEEYKGARTPISHKCLICNHIYKPQPSNVLGNQGCPKCAIKSRTMQMPEYLDIVNTVHNGKIQVLEEYKNSNTKIKHLCMKCNLIWDVIPESIRYGRGCPKCNHTGIQPKEYTLGTRNVIVRGYEPFALDYLINVKGIDSEKIFVFSEKVVPIIEFTFRRKKCRHYPDIFILEQNLLVEVKSPYTFGFYSHTHFEGDTPDGHGLFLKNKAKCKASKKEGYKYEILLFENKKLIQLPKNWYNMKYEKLIEICGYQ
jgi:predicted  nucleic acid-binding Zn-ribbon protein